MEDNEKLKVLMTISNPKIVMKRAKQYYGNDTKIYISSNKNKKYMIFNPNKNKFIHFGSFNPPMEDYTYHNNNIRREKYLKRTAKIKGDWKNDPYSANNMSRVILWNADY